MGIWHSCASIPWNCNGQDCFLENFCQGMPSKGNFPSLFQLSLLRVFTPPFEWAEVVQHSLWSLRFQLHSWDWRIFLVYYLFLQGMYNILKSSFLRKSFLCQSQIAQCLLEQKKLRSTKLLCCNLCFNDIIDHDISITPVFRAFHWKLDFIPV